jgi:hypothetical protein
LLPEVLDLAFEMGVSLFEFSIFDVWGQKIVFGELEFGMEGIDFLDKGLNVKIGGLRWDSGWDKVTFFVIGNCAHGRMILVSDSGWWVLTLLGSWISPGIFFLVSWVFAVVGMGAMMIGMFLTVTHVSIYLLSFDWFKVNRNCNYDIW